MTFSGGAPIERLRRREWSHVRGASGNAVRDPVDLARLKAGRFDALSDLGVVQVDRDLVAILVSWNFDTAMRRMAHTLPPVLDRKSLRDRSDLWRSESLSVVEHVVFVALGHRESAVRVLGRLAPIGEAVLALGGGAHPDPVTASDYDWRGIRVVTDFDGRFVDSVDPVPTRTPVDELGLAPVQVRLWDEQIFDLGIRRGAFDTATAPAASAMTLVDEISA